MKKKGLRSGVEIETVQARIAASKLMFARVLRERDQYVRALALTDGAGDWSRFANVAENLANSWGTAQTVPLSFRYAIWLQSQASGEPPVIRYPRTAAGDEVFAPTIEELLLRVWIESGAVSAWQQAIFDLCGIGAACVWYGFHADIATAEEVQGASEGVEDTVKRALQGSIDPSPGQDHAMASRALDSQAADPLNRMVMPLDAQAALAGAASAQDQAALKAAAAMKVPSVEDREIWARRLLVGKQVIWDHTVSDVREASWMARRIVMRVEAAKKFGGFAPGVRGRIEGDQISNDDGVNMAMNVAGQPLDSDENKRFVFWQVFDRTSETVHYVHERMPEFLEADESYPYPHPTTGRPAIPGFYPCSISAPVKYGLDIPERTLGVALIAPGFPLQLEIEKLHRFAMASVKRHAARAYEVAEGIDDETLAQLEDGVDAAFIKRPAGIEPGDMVKPIQFSGEAYRMIELIGSLTGEWASVQGMPMADLTSQPQADTATAETLSVSAGRNQADFVMRQIEDDMAHGVEVQRAMLAIGLYPPEKIASLIGPGRDQIMEGWKASSLDGDHITLKSATRAKSEQVVRIKQLGDALSLTVGYVDPKLGLPVYDASPIVEEILLALDVGRPKRIEWTPEDIILRQTMTGGAGADEGVGEEGGKGGPPNRGDGAGKRGQGPPSKANVTGGARREGT